MINHPNRSNLFTVIRPSGTPEAEGCTVAEAADVILSYDGATYEVRRAASEYDVAGEPQWLLWSKRQNGQWTCFSSVKGFYAASAVAAWPLIAKEVLKLAPGWRHSCHVIADEEYQAAMAEAAADQGE